MIFKFRRYFSDFYRQKSGEIKTQDIVVKIILIPIKDCFVKKIFPLHFLTKIKTNYLFFLLLLFCFVFLKSFQNISLLMNSDVFYNIIKKEKLFIYHIYGKKI